MNREAILGHLCELNELLEAHEFKVKNQEEEGGLLMPALTGGATVGAGYAGWKAAPHLRQAGAGMRAGYGYAQRAPGLPYQAPGTLAATVKQPLAQAPGAAYRGGAAVGQRAGAMKMALLKAIRRGK